MGIFQPLELTFICSGPMQEPISLPGQANGGTRVLQQVILLEIVSRKRYILPAGRNMRWNIGSASHGQQRQQCIALSEAPGLTMRDELRVVLDAAQSAVYRVIQIRTQRHMSGHRNAGFPGSLDDRLEFAGIRIFFIIKLNLDEVIATCLDRLHPIGCECRARQFFNVMARRSHYARRHISGLPLAMIGNAGQVATPGATIPHVAYRRDAVCNQQREMQPVRQSDGVNVGIP